MMRKVLSIAMALMTILCVNAQMPQPTPLPLNPKVRSGKLPNGLEYFILHNEEPKNRANFYIAQKVGSTLETQEQLGLAHFLEHMAFNGTKNFPGKAMLNYLQDKGIKFGDDINAYTGFDETVYRVNNVPTTDKNLMDSCLLVLHDWSCAIELLDSEIDAERGVIQEEWRSTTNATRRMMSTILPSIFDEYQYHQMPIGTMEVVMNFPYQAIRDYYHKWYRPDQQGIIIVGDFDVDEMETKVRDLFSKISMPENAAPRIYPSVSKNVEPIFASYRDGEFPTTTVNISYKEDPTPREMRSTVEGYLYGPVMEWFLSSLINHRLSDFATTAECAYSNAVTYFGSFWVTDQMEAFNIRISPKGNETVKATDQAMAIIARACKTGFTQSEVDRVRDEIMSAYENSYNERDNTDNHALGQELIRYFIDNTATPGIETEYQLVSQILPSIPVEMINQLASGLLTPDNQCIVVSQPDKDMFTVVTKEEMVASINNAMNADYEPMKEEVITDPLIASLPTPGSIVNVSEDGKFNASVITLSNGVKVVVKNTDFAKDQILFQAFREGGRRAYDIAEAANVNVLPLALQYSKYGPFDQKTLKKYLAGKNIGLSFNLANYTEYFSGSSSVKDLPTFMELLYTMFTNVNPDQEYYDVQINNMKNRLQMAEQTPDYIFGKLANGAEYGNNPMMPVFSTNLLESANYDKMLQLYRNSIANAADYTMIFTGNVDVETLRPLLEQYVASLPAGPRNKVQNVTNISPVLGKVSVSDECKAEIANVFVMNIWSGNNLKYNTDNVLRINILAEILNMIYTETLREEEGGTYGASVWDEFNPNDGIWELKCYYKTNKDQYKTLMDRSQSELMSLLSEGAPADKFNRVKENILKEYEQNLRNNEYWASVIFSAERGFDTFTGLENAIKNLTLEEFNAWMKNVYNGQNEIEVVLDAQ